MLLPRLPNNDKKIISDISSVSNTNSTAGKRSSVASMQLNSISLNPNANSRRSTLNAKSTVAPIIGESCGETLKPNYLKKR